MLEPSTPYFSIIIPTYNHLQDCLIPCLNGLVRNTDFSDKELIIVANGCTDGTRGYIESLPFPPIKLLWFDEPLGYPKATNEGIKVASGEYLVLLNNDTIFDDEVWPDIWLHKLYKPFIEEDNVGITGPIQLYSPHTSKLFIVFFCAMIKRRVFGDIGLLDETFSPGFGEDIDFCIKAQNRGYKIKCVDPDAKPDHEKKMMAGGSFPVHHYNESTVHDIENWPEIVHEHEQILARRYGTVKVSIIIPTYNHLEDCLKPCLDSIIKYTDLSDKEVIVVANGCKDGTRNYVESLPAIKMLWFDEPLGYTKATNEGIKAAKGEYVVLLNNDTILLEQRKDTWISMLLDPFSRDEKVGITGPLQNWCAVTNRSFLVFFCVMIPMKLINELGLLDEIFSPGFGEDIDFCIKAERAGYHFVRVPEQIHAVNESNHDQRVAIGNFPIYHLGEGTIPDVVDMDAKIDRNNQILKFRYKEEPIKLNLGCGEQSIDGYVNIDVVGTKADVYWDCTKLDLFLNNTVDEIFASHLLEHFDAHDVTNILREWNRVLKPGHKLIMELPDIEALCEHFTNNTDEQERYMVLNCIYGTLLPEYPHRFGWYAKILFDHLAWAGYTNMVKLPQQGSHFGCNMRIEAEKPKSIIVKEPELPKISIVIPTYNHLEDCLKPCLETIIKYTNLSNIEVIVSANGCTDGTREYVESLGTPFKLVWSDEPLGYIKATNKGIEVAIGEYILLLNNDIELLEQPVNQWIEMLLGPFQDPAVGGTGPMKVISTETEKDFLIFFCAMFKKEMFNRFGLLDEIFHPGQGEDVDFCAKMIKGGYKLVQVPSFSDRFDKDRPKMMLGEFPIYHRGSTTFKDVDPDDVMLNRNKSILKYRYMSGPIKLNLGCGGVNFPHYINIDIKHQGPNSPGQPDLLWDCEDLRVFLDNTVDEILTLHLLEHFDIYSVNKILAEWFRVLKPGGLLIMELPNIEDAFKEFLETDKLQRYMLVNTSVYGTGDPEHPHRFGWWPEIMIDHLQGNGFIDIKHLPAIFWHVGKNMRFEARKPGIMSSTYTVTTESPVALDPSRPMVYDCFPFFNEMEVLDIRLHTLSEVVDYFVLVEATYTHSGKPKPLYFAENKIRYEKFLDKIIHVVVEDMPNDPKDSWINERFQRDAIMRALTPRCKDSDIVIIGDADEIANPEAVVRYKRENGIMHFVQSYHYYYLNCISQKHKWEWLKILPWSMLKDMTPCQVRYTHDTPGLEWGGWHFSFLGSVEHIIQKIESFAHTEYDRPEIKDPQILRQKIAEGADIFNRTDHAFAFFALDNYFPPFIRDHALEFTEKGLVRYEPMQTDDLPPGWFTTRDINAYRTLVEQLPDHAKFAELGVWKGRSLCSVADIINRKKITPVAVDTFAGSESERSTTHFEATKKDLMKVFKDNCAKYNLSPVVIKDTTINVARQFSDGYFDMVFIDASHEPEDVRMDIKTWYPKVKPGGILAGHDWEYSNEIKNVIREELRSEFNESDVMFNVWWIRKDEKDRNWYQWRYGGDGLGGTYERFVYGRNHVVPEATTEYVRYKWAAENLVGKNILEIGCGVGYGIRFLPDGIIYTGIDHNGDAIGFARENYGDKGTFEVAEIHNYNFKHYDTIIAMEIIEHLIDGLAIVEDLKKHCDCLLVSVPHKQQTQKSYHKLFNLTAADFKDFEVSYLDMWGNFVNENGYQMLLKWTRRK